MARIIWNTNFIKKAVHLLILVNQSKQMQHQSNRCNAKMSVSITFISVPNKPR